MRQKPNPDLLNKPKNSSLYGEYLWLKRQRGTNEWFSMLAYKTGTFISRTPDVQTSKSAAFIAVTPICGRHANQRSVQQLCLRNRRISANFFSLQKCLWRMLPQQSCKHYLQQAWRLFVGLVQKDSILLPRGARSLSHWPALVIVKH